MTTCSKSNTTSSGLCHLLRIGRCHSLDSDSTAFTYSISIFSKLVLFGWLSFLLLWRLWRRHRHRVIRSLLTGHRIIRGLLAGHRCNRATTNTSGSDPLHIVCWEESRLTAAVLTLPPVSIRLLYNLYCFSSTEGKIPSLLQKYETWLRRNMERPNALTWPFSLYGHSDLA